MWSTLHLWVSLLGFLTVVWNLLVAPSLPGYNQKRIARIFVGGIAILSILIWICTYFIRPLHPSDFYHYYIGGKYFSELGYTGIYECTIQAEEEAGFGGEVQESSIRDLQTDKIRNASKVLLESKCKKSFSAIRWAEFKKDVLILKSYARSQDKWREGLNDHGYNATPVWGMIGGTIAKFVPLSQATVTIMTSLDCILMIVMWIVVSRVFGFNAVTTGLIFWCSNYPAEFSWTVGGLLRTDWLVCLIFSICALRAGFGAVSGAFLAGATLLKIFPGALMFGLVAYLFHRWRRKLPVLETQTLRFGFGFCIMSLVLVVSSFIMSGRTNPYYDFYRNINKHAFTPAPNIVSLSKLLSYGDSTLSNKSSVEDSEDPGAQWRERQVENFKNRKPIYWGLLLVFFGLFLASTSNLPLWATLSLATIWPPLASPLTNYYLMVIIPITFLADIRPLTAVGLVAFGWISVVVGSRLMQDELTYPIISGVLVFCLFVILLERKKTVAKNL